MATAKKSAAGAKKTAAKKSSAKSAAKGASKGAAKSASKVAAKSPAKKAAPKSAAKTATKSAAKGATKSAAKAPAAKKAGAKRALNPALAAPMTPSSDLAAVIGSAPVPRSEVAKKIWAYIHKNGLQDQTNRRNINADDKLRTVFGGKEQVSMFEMTSLVNKHLKPA